ncbi:hypothetical protein GCK32_015743, partial [Trichostrongylus colubriformis]
LIPLAKYLTTILSSRGFHRHKNIVLADIERRQGTPAPK